MTRIAFVNGRLLTSKGMRDHLALVIDRNRIESIGGEAPPTADVIDLKGATVLPGFIDVQVNGGGGRMFNDDPSPETISCMVAAHRPFGTTGMLPTLISDDLDVVERAIRAVDEAIDAQIPGVLGIHLEGPFLSTQRKGIHRADKLRVLRDDHLDLLMSLKRGVTLVTLAPECATLDQIRQLVAGGVRVSLGHSNADYDTTRAALDAGATGFTHLFNAMSQLVGREPGMVGAALSSDSAYAGMIVDGQHVHPAAIRAAFRAMGADRLMLVSDAMSMAGVDAPGFCFQGTAITRTGDRLHDAAGTLAGSVATMLSTVTAMMDQANVTLARAVRMASYAPAAFLGLSDARGTLEEGKLADFVVVDQDLDVLATWVEGQLRYAK